MNETIENLISRKKSSQKIEQIWYKINLLDLDYIPYFFIIHIINSKIKYFKIKFDRFFDYKLKLTKTINCFRNTMINTAFYNKSQIPTEKYLVVFLIL